MTDHMNIHTMVKEGKTVRPPPVLIHWFGSERSRCETISAQELVAKELPEPCWVLPGLLPEGFAVLAGPPKVGKSWLALDIATGVAGGEAALCELPVCSGAVLYLALEDPNRRVKKRLQEIDRAPAGLEIATRWPRADEGGLDAIGSWLMKHPDARLVVIDTLQRIRRPRRGKVDLYASDYADGEGLHALAARHGVAVLVLHHTRKQESPDPLDLVSGTHGLTGAADTVLVLKRVRGKADATLSIVGRDVEERDLALRFQSCRWVLLGDACDWAISPERRAIIDLLLRTGPLVVSAIAEQLGKNRNTVKTLVQKMVQDGRLESTESGYALVAGDASSPSSVPSMAPTVTPVTHANHPAESPRVTASSRSVARKASSREADRDTGGDRGDSDDGVQSQARDASARKSESRHDLFPFGEGDSSP